MGSGSGGYYLDLAREDYYLNGGEPDGVWFGTGAAALHLPPVVGRAELAALLEGRAPDGSPLVQQQHYQARTRQPGWDFTFSAPKSVSVLWSQAPQGVRAAIQRAQQEAVQAALAYLEREAAFTRRGKGGETFERVAGLVASLFEHGTSRAHDPQLHTHVLVLNAALRADGTWGGLWSRALYEHRHAADAIYRATLAHELRRTLGVELVAKDRWFEVAGIPEGLVRTFSKRREAIEELLLEHGWKGAKAAEAAALATRLSKDHVPRAALVEEWQAVGRELGFSTKEVLSLLRKGPPAHEEPGSLLVEVEKALSRLTEHQSTFFARDLVRRVTDAVQARGTFSGPAIAEAVKQVLKNSEAVVSLEPRHGLARYTTKEMLALERSLFEAAARLQGNSGHQVAQVAVEAALVSRPTMKAEQREALFHITTSEGALQLVSGMAGTGKSYLLGAAREAWEAEGMQVVGTALAAKAARELETSAGIHSRTLASLCFALEQGKPLLDAKTVLVIDEAGMVGTRTMERVLRHAESAGAKVVLVGDERQLQPIDAGSPFRGLLERLGGATLTEITRQRESWMREAVHQLADGDARGALSEFAVHGCLHVGKDREETMRQLVQDWAKEPCGDATLILAGTRADAAALNRLVQNARLQHGALESGLAACAGEQRFFAGDRVVFTKNHKLLGVMNGDFGTLEAVLKGSQVLVRLDREVRGVPVRVSLDLPHFTDLALGYAVTTHKAQGVTLERTLVLAGGWMQDRELSYVQMSRARGETHIFVTERDAGEDIAALTHSMELSRRKDMAHDYVLERAI